MLNISSINLWEVPYVEENSFGFTVALGLNFEASTQYVKSHYLELFGILIQDEFIFYIDVKYPSRIPIVQVYEINNNLNQLGKK